MKQSPPLGPVPPSPDRAGWYSVEGGPPGTMRRWDGREWVGFPVIVDDRHAPLPEPDRVQDPLSGAASAKHDGHGPLPDPDQVTPLTWAGLGGGLLAIALALVMACLAAGTTVLLLGNGVEIVGSTGAAGPVDTLAWSAALSWTVVAMAIAAPAAFLATVRWSTLAATAAAVARTRGQSLEQVRLQSPGVYPWQSGFLGTASVVTSEGFVGVPPGWGRRARTRRSASAYRDLADASMLVGTNPQTGQSEIEPVTLLVWRSLWWGSLIGLAALGSAAFVLSPLSVRNLQTVVEIAGLLAAALACSQVALAVSLHRILRRL